MVALCVVCIVHPPLCLYLSQCFSYDNTTELVFCLILVTFTHTKTSHIWNLYSHIQKPRLYQGTIILDLISHRFHKCPSGILSTLHAYLTPCPHPPPGQPHSVCIQTDGLSSSICDQSWDLGPQVANWVKRSFIVVRSMRDNTKNFGSIGSFLPT